MFGSHPKSTSIYAMCGGGRGNSCLLVFTNFSQIFHIDYQASKDRKSFNGLDPLLLSLPMVGSDVEFSPRISDPSKGLIIRIQARADNMSLHFA